MDTTSIRFANDDLSPSKVFLSLVVMMGVLLCCQNHQTEHKQSESVITLPVFMLGRECRAVFVHDTLRIIDSIKNTSGLDLVLTPSLAFIRDAKNNKFVLSIWSSPGNEMYFSKDSTFILQSMADRRIIYDPAYRIQFYLLKRDSSITFEFTLPLNLRSLSKFKQSRYLTPFNYCAWPTEDRDIQEYKKAWITTKRARLFLFHNTVTSYPYKDPFIYNLLTLDLENVIDASDSVYDKLSTSNIGRVSYSNWPVRISSQ